MYHSTLGSRVIKKKKEQKKLGRGPGVGEHLDLSREQADLSPTPNPGDIFYP